MAGRLHALKRALDIVGTRPALAHALWTSDEELKSYLEGKKPIPDAIYQGALDIVAKKKRARKR